MADPSNGFTVKEMLLRLEEKVDVIVENVASKEQINDHEDRIRFLERWRYALPASALTAVVAVSLAVSQLLH